jgi:hypothetical protein
MMAGRLKRAIIGLSVAFGVGVSALPATALAIQPVHGGGVGAAFAATATCGSQNFFNFPTWYKYLAAAGKMRVNSATNRCEVISTLQVQDLSLIALALVDIGLRVASLAAVGYVVYGGIQFVVAQGETDKTRKARQTIINALIGMTIALISVGLVAFVGARIGGAAVTDIIPHVQTTGKLQVILNTVLGITGAIAVLIIVLAGFRYIVSQGNPNEISTAKNAILYSLIGLVVIMFAFAIVNFVLQGVG